MKKLLITSITFLSFPVLVMAAFSDVPTHHLNFDAIDYVQNQGIVKGYEDGAFKPDTQINRAEFTKIIVEATVNQSEIAGSSCFPDIHEEWYAKYVCTAKKQNIIAGYPDGTFKPENKISFVEAAKIISKSFHYETEEESVWYRPYVNILAKDNAIPSTVKDLTKEISRGEMAEIIYRLKQGIKTKESMELKDEQLIQKIVENDASPEITNTDDEAEIAPVVEMEDEEVVETPKPEEILLPIEKKETKENLESLLEPSLENSEEDKDYSIVNVGMEDKKDEYYANIPGENWAIYINSDRFAAIGITKHIERSRIFGADAIYGPQKYLLITVTIDKVSDRIITDNDCQEYHWQQLKVLPGTKSFVKKYDVRQGAITEYISKSYKDVVANKDSLYGFSEREKEVYGAYIAQLIFAFEINQKNMFLYQKKDNYCVRTHLSRILWEVQDDSLLKVYFDRILYDKPYLTPSAELFMIGDDLFDENNYKAARSYLEMAFEREEGTRTLPRNVWSNLVDELGISYALTGDFEKAITTLKYGAGKYPKFLPFHYTQAVLHAKENNVEEAVKALEFILKYRDINSREIPNLRQDSAFDNINDDPRFIEIIDKILINE